MNRFFTLNPFKFIDMKAIVSDSINLFSIQIDWMLMSTEPMVATKNLYARVAVPPSPLQFLANDHSSRVSHVHLNC